MAYSFVSRFGDAPYDMYQQARPEYEFGTNTGNQGTFNKQDPAQVKMALERLRELYNGYGDTLDHNFTGDTGLGKDDRQGYSTMLNARTEASNIQRQLQGEDPLRVKYGGVMHPAVTGLMQPQTRRSMPQLHNQWMLGNEPHERFVKRNKGY